MFSCDSFLALASNRLEENGFSRPKERTGAAGYRHPSTVGSTCVFYSFVFNGNNCSKCVCAKSHLGYALMRQDLEESLVKAFPQLFADCNGDPAKTCMAFGCSCGDGWYNLIYDACYRMMESGLQPETTFLQIKEKFGGLRLYMAGATPEIAAIAETAEEESYKICDNCGSHEDVTSEGNWVATLCKKCRNKSHS